MLLQNSLDSRLDVAKLELSKAILGLPDGALVEIINFSTVADSWFGDLKPLTKAFKYEITNRIKGLSAKGGTNTHDSFEKALNVNDNLEAIYFLSDGAPSLGPIVKNDDLQDQIYRWNRFRKVQIHCIGLVFGLPPKGFDLGTYKENIPTLKSFLSQLAIQNNGQFKFIE